MPSPVFMYAQRATTRTSLSARSPSSVTRVPSNATAGSTERPFSVISETSGATRSRKVDAPSLARNRTVLVEANVVSSVVRSSCTTYDETVTRSARLSRLVPGEVHARHADVPPEAVRKCPTHAGSPCPVPDRPGGAECASAAVGC
jgi:hypothetical protein